VGQVIVGAVKRYPNETHITIKSPDTVPVGLFRVIVAVEPKIIPGFADVLALCKIFVGADGIDPALYLNIKLQQNIRPVAAKVKVVLLVKVDDSPS
tara:strand:- start:127 stop:414 length:288 start_codon:yes stop_codon:yes gene_type:complete